MLVVHKNPSDKARLIFSLKVIKSQILAESNRIWHSVGPSINWS